MKSRFSKMLGMGLVAAGLMLAQTPQPTPTPGTPAAPGARMHRRGRMLRALNLTPDQKTQAKTIFQAAHATAQPIAAQMRDARLALSNAAKSNAPDAEIDRLSNNAANLSSQLMAIRAKAFEKFYTILTPDQKTKLDSMKGNRVLKG